MSENLEACPYCGNHLKKNSFVCAPCGAYKAEKGLSSSDKGLLFIGGLHWLSFGPGFLLVAIFSEKMSNRMFSVLFGAAVCYLGFIFFRRIFRLSSEVVWKRKF